VFFAGESGDAAGGGSFVPLLMIVLLFAVMYFLLIRPQQKRRQQAVRMQSELAVGDEVITVGGLYGTIAAMDDEAVSLEVAPGVQTRYARSAVARVVTSIRQETADSESSAQQTSPIVDGDTKD
jgi:preprotein translocase subunit YajC